jgi:hypothetical protein
MNPKNPEETSLEALHPAYGRALEPRFIHSITGGLVTRVSVLQFIRAFFQTSEVRNGYYLEFGVFNGSSMLEVYGLLRGLVTHLYGFDSFDGLPDLSSEDSEAAPMTPSFVPGNFRSIGVDAVRQLILAGATRLGAENLILTPGFYENTLPAFDTAQLADKGPCLIAHVDCDLYSSSRDVFAFLDGVVTTGTWLLLDDYWAYRGSPKFGQRRAFEEWMATSTRIGATEYTSYNGFCKAYVLYEK